MYTNQIQDHTMYSPQRRDIYPQLDDHHKSPPPPVYQTASAPYNTNYPSQPYHSQSRDDLSYNDLERERVQERKGIRNRIILKMYITLLCQLVLILTVIFFVAMFKTTNDFFEEQFQKILGYKFYILPVVALVLLILILLLKRPWVFIPLVLFDIFVGFLYAIYDDGYEVNTNYYKLIAVGIAVTFCFTNTWWAFRN